VIVVNENVEEDESTTFNLKER